MKWYFVVWLALAVMVWGEEVPGPSPSAPAPKSRVVWMERPSVVDRFAVNDAGVRSMFIAALQVYTGQKNLGLAWRQLGVQPNDIVGIKINASLGTVMSTRRCLVDIVVESLLAAGVAPQHILVWDKFGNDLEISGWLPRAEGEYPLVRSVIPGAGFDGQQYYVNEVMGKLIWGDYLFRGKKPTKDDLLRLAAAAARSKTDDVDPETKHRATDEADQTSNRSYFTTLVTQTFTKIINIPVMADHPDWGISGCLSSLAMASVDNTRRFADQDYAGDPAIAEILDRDLFRKKVVLHIMDGLIAQYAGAPQFTPLYTQSIGALYLSTDPVAIDTLILPRLEAWRKTAHIVPIGAQAKHIKGAADAGLGQNDLNNISLLELQ